MKFVIADDIPLTILVKELVLVAIVFVVLEAMALIVFWDKLFAFKVVMLALVIVALLDIIFCKLEVVAIKLLVARLVPVAFVKSKFCIKPLMAVKVLVKKLPVLFRFSVVVVPVKFKLLSPSILVVETMPLIIEVIKLVVDEKLKLLVVVAAISEAKEVVEIIPFTSVVMMPVDVAKDTVLFEITELVAITPLIVVVKVLPERD
jgi:hypothetical protein